MRMTPRVIVIGGLAVVLTVVSFVVFLPYAIFRPLPTRDTLPYTQLEQEGRQVFISNGCMYCHSQFTRPEDVTPNKPSQAGDYVYDQPHQLGTIRTGPDLADIGMKRGDQWEIDHLKNPREFTPNSIMPRFEFLSDTQLRALAAYLDRLGNHELASTDLMVKEPYETTSQPFPVTKENWDKGRRIYATHCLTCHGCAGKGDGPYAMVNNARPADLRQPNFPGRPDTWQFNRISEGVPGTVMPKWKQTLSVEDRWLVLLFERHAFMNMAPHLADEGDLPAKYDIPDPVQDTTENVDAGKAVFVQNCAYCHGYAGNGDGPDAAGLLPAPPDFNDTAFYSTFKFGDWFWRVSESLPMRAMPQWKYVLTERERLLVANYVKSILALPRKGREPEDIETPERYATLQMPGSVSWEQGQRVYYQRCVICHGPAGQGEGPDGARLVPVPANFTDPDVRDTKKMPDGRWFWRVSFGVRSAAMPQWRFLLSEQERWDLVYFAKTTFTKPPPPAEAAAAAPTTPPIEYSALATPQVTPDRLENGKALYEEWCAECHGVDAKGPATPKSPDVFDAHKLVPAPGGLVAKGATADTDWWYWKVSAGAPRTSMAPWLRTLTEEDRWDVVFYARSLVGVKD